MPVDLPLPTPPLVVSAKEVREAYASNYFEGGRKVASSRETPASMPAYPLGTWQVDDVRLTRGHELSVLVELWPRDLEPSEFDWGAPLRTFNRSKHRDLDQYQRWREQGLRPPPIVVVETDRSTLRVVDGHRRVLAAEALGEPVLAWLGPMIEDPEGARDSAGHVLLVPLTYELATGRDYTPNDSPPARVTPGVHSQLEAVVEEHNARMTAPWQRLTPAMAAQVVRRGGYSRLARFLHLLEHGRPRAAAYTGDNDLLPPGHPYDHTQSKHS